MCRFLCIFLFLHTIFGCAIPLESVENYQVSSIPVSKSYVATLKPKSVEERFKEHYEGKPGILGLADQIYTDIDSGRQFRKISVSPDGSCNFYSTGLTREKLVKILTEYTLKYDDDYRKPENQELWKIFSTTDLISLRLYSYMTRQLTKEGTSNLIRYLQDAVGDVATSGSTGWLHSDLATIKLEIKESIIKSLGELQRELKETDSTVPPSPRIVSRIRKVHEAIFMLIRSCFKDEKEFELARNLRTYNALLTGSVISDQHAFTYYSYNLGYIKQYYPNFILSDQKDLWGKFLEYVHGLSKEAKTKLYRRNFLERKDSLSEFLALEISKILDLKNIYAYIHNDSNDKIMFGLPPLNFSTRGSTYRRYILSTKVNGFTAFNGHADLLIPLEPTAGLDV